MAAPQPLRRGRVANLGGWLTTVVARVCLDMLRSRRSRREELVGTWLPEPIVSADDGRDPEPSRPSWPTRSGIALLVVLDTLSPAERLAFVLHDMFGVPFEEIAPIVDRTPAAARQLASRARRRVRGAAPSPDPDLARQREVVAAFLAAARAGDFDALLEVLDPDVVFRVDARARPARAPAGGGRAGRGARAADARPALRAARAPGDRQRRRGPVPRSRPSARPRSSASPWSAAGSPRSTSIVDREKLREVLRD